MLLESKSHHIKVVRLLIRTLISCSSLWSFRAVSRISSSFPLETLFMPASKAFSSSSLSSGVNIALGFLWQAMVDRDHTYTHLFSSAIDYTHVGYSSYGDVYYNHSLALYVLCMIFHPWARPGMGPFAIYTWTRPFFVYTVTWSTCLK